MDINPASSSVGRAHAASTAGQIQLKSEASEASGRVAAMSKDVAIIKSQEHRDTTAVQGGKGKNGRKGKEPRFEQDLTGILRGFPEVWGRYGLEGREAIPKTAYHDIGRYVDMVNNSPLTKKLEKSVDENFLKTKFCEPDKNGKVRHEISPDGKSIRATDGYAEGVRDYSIDTPAVTPPAVLYHGTVVTNLDSIQKDGLLGMEREYVSLTSDKRVARDTAKRHDGGDPSRHRLLEVSALALHEAPREGSKRHEFYNIGKVWQTKTVPPQYIKVVDWDDGKKTA